MAASLGLKLLTLGSSKLGCEIEIAHDLQHLGQ